MSLTKATYSMISGAYINVLDYGADSTGVADSSTAIQNAINAIPGTGGVVYLPSGTYKVATTLTWPISKNLIFMGAGASGAGNGTTQKAATEISYTGAATCLQMHGTSWDANQVGGVLKDLYIKGSGTGGSTIGVSLRWASGSTGRISFENVFVDQFNTGYKFDALLDGTFINCQARGCNIGWYCVGLNEAVNSNVWVGCAADSSATGIKFQEGCNANRWFGGTIQGNITGAYITGDTFGPSCNGFIATYFESDQPASQGLAIDKGASATQPLNNYAENCLFTSWAYGVRLLSGVGTRIRGARFLNMGGAKTPILISTSATNTLIEDNINDAGNNGYNIASSGAGTIIREFASNNLETKVVGASGSISWKSDGDLFQMKNLTSGTTYFDWNTNSSTPRLDVANAAQIIGYSDNFSTATFKLGATIRVPSYTTTQRNALTSIANGDMIYNTTDGKFQGYQAGAWVNFV